MVLEYFANIPVSQKGIMNVARTTETDGTMSHDLVRAAHFSSSSTAASDQFPEAFYKAGYPGRPVGFSSFVHSSSSTLILLHNSVPWLITLPTGPWLEEAKNIIAKDIPLIVLQKFGLNDSSGTPFTPRWAGCWSDAFLGLQATGV